MEVTDIGSAQVLVSSAPPIFAKRDIPPLGDANQHPNGEKDDRILCVIKMLGSTICASDIHTADGRRPAVPSDPKAECTLGHEGIGVVVSKSFKTPDFRIGDIVTFAVSVSGCVAEVAEKCGHCQMGLPQKCIKLYKYGHEAYKKTDEAMTALSGTYATHMILPKGSCIVPIARGSEPLPAPLALCCIMNCGGATAVAAIRVACRGLPIASLLVASQRPLAKRRVAVFGGGPLGLMAALRACYLGAEEVSILDIKPAAIAVAKAFGFSTELIGNYDAVIEACGSKAVLPKAINSLRIGGILVLVGLVHPNSDLSAITAETLIRKCLTVVGVHNYTPEDLKNTVSFIPETWAKHKEAFELAGLGKSAPKFALDDINSGLEKAREFLGRVILKP